MIEVLTMLLRIVLGMFLLFDTLANPVAQNDFQPSQDQLVAQINPLPDVECASNNIKDEFDDEQIQKSRRSSVCLPSSLQNSGGPSDDPAVIQRIDSTNAENRCSDILHPFLHTCGGPQVGVYPSNMILNCISGELSTQRVQISQMHS